MTMPPPAREVARTTLSVLAIGGLLAASFLVLEPFLPALVWATTIVVASWPLLRRLQGWFGGRRAPAVTVMVAALLAVVVVPVYLAIATIVSSADGIAAFVTSLDHSTLPPPPAWLESVPLIGDHLAAGWQELSAGGLAALGVDLAPYASRAVKVLASQAGSFGATVVLFLVTLIIVGMLLAGGEAAGLGARRFFRRLAGERGDSAVILAGKAIRAVALGVMVTALTQTVLSGVGLAIARVPHAGLLTALILVLCVAQVGPGLILVPSIIWAFATGRTGAGFFLLIWSVAPLTVDNFLKPYFIKKGADLPLWLIFAGVVGGLLSFGIIGLFIGPVVLAVTYTLVQDWVADLGPEAAAAPPPTAEGRPATGVGGTP